MFPGLLEVIWIRLLIFPHSDDLSLEDWSVCPQLHPDSVVIPALDVLVDHPGDMLQLPHVDVVETPVLVPLPPGVILDQLGVPLGGQELVKLVLHAALPPLVRGLTGEVAQVGVAHDQELAPEVPHPGQELGPSLLLLLQDVGPLPSLFHSR